MKKTVLFGMALLCTLGLFGCKMQKEQEKVVEDEGVHVVNSFAKTPDDQIETAEEVIEISYDQMSDDTWCANGMTYAYKLEVSGTMNSKEPDTTYTILSNRYPISFEQAFKESALTHAGNKFFDLEDAVIVAVRISERKMPEVQCVLHEEEVSGEKKFNTNFLWGRHELGDTIEVYYKNEADTPAMVTLYRYNRIAAQKELGTVTVAPHSEGVYTYTFEGTNHGAYSVGIVEQDGKALAGELRVYQLEERYR